MFITSIVRENTMDDYARAQSEYYYVDKTLLIKEFLDKKPMVSYRFHAVIFFRSVQG